jgi:ABC-type multidrug transport system ATPase subunit
MLKRLKRQGITILVSTAYMDEANLCERIALIQEGKILSVDTPDHIVNAYPRALYAVKATQMHQLLKDIREYPGTLSCYSFGDYLHVSFKDIDEQEKTRLEKWLGEKGHKNLEIKKIPASIEDSFIQLMNPNSP